MKREPAAHHADAARHVSRPASARSGSGCVSARRGCFRPSGRGDRCIVSSTIRSNSVHQAGGCPPKLSRNAATTACANSGRRRTGTGEVRSCSAASASSGLNAADCSRCHRYQARSLPNVFEYGRAPARNLDRPLGLIRTCRETARNEVAPVRCLAAARMVSTNSVSPDEIVSGSMCRRGKECDDPVHSDHKHPLRATQSIAPPAERDHRSSDAGRVNSLFFNTTNSE